MQCSRQGKREQQAEYGGKTGLPERESNNRLNIGFLQLVNNVDGARLKHQTNEPADNTDADQHYSNHSRQHLTDEIGRLKAGRTPVFLHYVVISIYSYWPESA